MKHPHLLSAVSILLSVFVFLPATGGVPQFEDVTATRVFTTTVDVNTDDFEKDIAVADFDRDGWPDIVVVRKQAFYQPLPGTHLLLMNSNGTLKDATAMYAPQFLSAPSGARDVVVADFNQDGWPDLVIANTFLPPSPFWRPPFYYENLKSTNGKWNGLAMGPAGGIPVFPPLPLMPQSCAVGVGDVTGDGFPDVMLGNYGPSNEASIDILFVNQGGTDPWLGFVDETEDWIDSSDNVPSFTTGVEIVDMNNDGALDILRSFAGVTTILFNDPILGTFSPGERLVTEMDVTDYMATAGDLDNDGYLDVYITGDFPDAKMINNGDETFTDETLRCADFPNICKIGGNTHIADLDGDNYPEVGVGPIDVSAGNCPGPTDPDDLYLLQDFAILDNVRGDLVDPPGAPHNYSLDIHDFAFVDVDRDGKLDIFMGGCTGYKLFRQLP